MKSAYKVFTSYFFLFFIAACSGGGGTDGGSDGGTPPAVDDVYSLTLVLTDATGQVITIFLMPHQVN